MAEKEDPKEPEIPMPVPSAGMESSKDQSKTGNTSKGKPKKEHKPKTDDSDQSTQPPQSREKTGQKGAEDSTTDTPSETPAPTPPVESAPPLPFEKDDLLAGKNPPPPIKDPPAVASPTSPQPVSDRSVDQLLSDKKTENWLKTQGGEYKVQGNARPDAASIQGAANKNKISTEILKAVQTDEFAEVIVRTHLGSQYVDTVVHHNFKNSRQIKLIEMAAKHPDTVEKITPDGFPIFKAGAEFRDQQGKPKNLMVAVMHTLLADIQFAIRDATTKASAAGQAKILNQDWQSEEELASEAHETELVNIVRGH